MEARIPSGVYVVEHYEMATQSASEGFRWCFVNEVDADAVATFLRDDDSDYYLTEVTYEPISANLDDKEFVDYITGAFDRAAFGRIKAIADS